MASVQNVLSVAASQIGYYAPSDPEPGSKYGRWMAALTGETWLRGPSRVVWWCAIFVSWCFAQAGISTNGLLPSYNCDQIRQRARSKGWVLGNKYAAQPGDIVLYDWNKNGSCDHIGIVEKNCGSYLQTIEGNTSSGNSGSQSAGNGVWRRTRSWNSVNCVIRVPMNGGGSAPAPAPAPAPKPSKRLIAVDGWWGPDCTDASQVVFGTPRDGIVSGQAAVNKKYLVRIGAGWKFTGGGSMLIKAIQRWAGATPDGYLGPNSIKAVQRKLGVTPDGYLGPITVKAYQRFINSRL